MEAIVLSRKDFREFDQLISFYTKEQGKLELLARGVKKIISKNSAHLEPFSNVFIEKVEGKEIDHLIRAVPIIFFSGIRKNLEKSLAAGYLVYFLEKITEINEPDKKIYDAVLGWLKFTDKTDKFSPILLDGIILILLSELGFRQIFEHCVVCKKTERCLMEKTGFYFGGGGLICVDCRGAKESVGEKIWDFDLKQISEMQLLLKGNWHLINEFEFGHGLHKLIYEFVLFHSEKKLSDWAIGI